MGNTAAEIAEGKNKRVRKTQGHFLKTEHKQRRDHRQKSRIQSQRALETN